MRTAHSAAREACVGLEPAGEEGAARSPATSRTRSSPAKVRYGSTVPGSSPGGRPGRRASRTGGPTRPCPPPARPRGRWPRPWRRPRPRRAGPPRSRRRRPGCPPCPSGTSGRRWPATGRPRGRCRPPWSWRCPVGPGSAAPRPRCGPGSTSGRRPRGAGRRPRAPRQGTGIPAFRILPRAPPTAETVWRFLSQLSINGRLQLQVDADRGRLPMISRTPGRPGSPR